MTALLCEEYQWSNYSYIGRPRRRPVLIFHRLPRERSERAPKSTANNGSSEPPLRHAPRGLSEQTAKHWLSPRRAENRDKMIKNCQAGLAITRSAVSPRQDKSLRFFSSLLFVSPQAETWGARQGRGQLPGGGGCGRALAFGLEVGAVCREPAGTWSPPPFRRHLPPVGPREPALLIPPRKTSTPVGGHALGHTHRSTPVLTHLPRTPAGAHLGWGLLRLLGTCSPDPALDHLGPFLMSFQALRLQLGHNDEAP